MVIKRKIILVTALILSVLLFAREITVSAYSTSLVNDRVYNVYNQCIWWDIDRIGNYGEPGGGCIEKGATYLPHGASGPGYYWALARYADVGQSFKCDGHQTLNVTLGVNSTRVFLQYSQTGEITMQPNSKYWTTLYEFKNPTYDKLGHNYYYSVSGDELKGVTARYWRIIKDIDDTNPVAKAYGAADSIRVHLTSDAGKVNVQYICQDDNKILDSYTTDYMLPQNYTAYSKNFNGYYLVSAANLTTQVEYNKTKILKFYYSKTDIKTGGGGKIEFNPISTPWTNIGKIGEGTGDYKVNVKYNGTSFLSKGTAKIISNGVTYDRNFQVQYDIKGINITGATDVDIVGQNGIVSITKEGANNKLLGDGQWSNPQYKLPALGSDEKLLSYDLGNQPPNIKGESGIYQLDWSNAPIEIGPSSNKWTNTPLSVGITIKDSLSGISDKSVINATDSSHYDNKYTINMYSVKGPNAEEDKSLILDKSGIYTINTKSVDNVGNTNEVSNGKYYVDTTSPQVTFNVTPGIFNSSNGAVQKPSKLGTDFACYGTITLKDDLSGCYKASYSWTYGNTDNGTYKDIYSSPYTYTDRNTESNTVEVEKPVGDNLYLHVKLADVAGNVTNAVFGPYEDSIKLKDFEVTDIRDSRWNNVFWKDSELTQPTNITYKVNKLPVDGDSHPTLKNTYPKKGYAFYFDLTSEYLYRDNDRIEIIPSFYYSDGVSRIPVDLYYDFNDNPLTKLGSQQDKLMLNMDKNKDKVLIGYLPKLTLTRGVRIEKGLEWKGWRNVIQYTNGKEQWWYGKYLIPSTSLFVKQGEAPVPENILKDNKIIVNFTIIAYKNGIETLSSDQIYSYLEQGQWKAEGGPKNNKYQAGDVMVYDNKYNALSDYETRVIQ